MPSSPYMFLLCGQMRRHGLTNCHARPSDLRAPTDERTYRFRRISSSAARVCRRAWRTWDEAAAGHVLPPAEVFAHPQTHCYCGAPNAGHRFLQDHLLSQYTANRAHTKERRSRGSLHHVQNVHLETRAESTADGVSSRGTF